METFRSLVALLARRAAEQAGDHAYVFVSDRGTEEAALTFRQLHDAATALAARLTAAARPGERAILVFPPGIEFMVAFFGCLMAGVIAVPMMIFPSSVGSRHRLPHQRQNAITPTISTMEMPASTESIHPIGMVSPKKTIW